VCSHVCRYAIVDYKQRYVNLQQATFSGVFNVVDEYSFQAVSVRVHCRLTDHCLIGISGSVMTQTFHVTRDLA
jgi:hypothetical protein